MYGGAAKFCAWVRLMVRKRLALQETTKLANWMIGYANNFQGIHNSFHSVVCWSRACNSLNWLLDGDPFPIIDPSSPASLGVLSECMPSSATTSFVWLEGLTSVDAVNSVDEVACRRLLRCHFVSGNRNTNMRTDKPRIPTLSQKKTRQPKWSAIGPAAVAPTCTMST